MANRLWDSFDFQEISALIQDLISKTDDHQKHPSIETKPVAPPEPPVTSTPSVIPTAPPEAAPVLEVKMNDQRIQRPEAQEPEGERLDPLEHALLRMCKQGDFHGAVLADFGGLPLAIHNSPVEGELLAAFTTIMGDSLGKAATLLNHTNANNISMDINYVDKIVLREFSVGEYKYFLMIICPQTVDERAEVEVSIAHISEIISRT